MNRAFFSDSIDGFLAQTNDSIIGKLVNAGSFSVETTQRDAWLTEIEVLRNVLQSYRYAGSIYFEFVVPRLGKRIDVVVLIGCIVFVLEFKVGERDFNMQAIDQVYDYALDLKNFHETSQALYIAPVLIATGSNGIAPVVCLDAHGDRVLQPICTGKQYLANVFSDALAIVTTSPIDRAIWEAGRYCPTPTIIEAATALYGGHSVEDISRNDAGAQNLTITSAVVADVIDHARAESKKILCFVTGVPGAGKTLVGLDIATKHLDASSELYSVFLFGKWATRCSAL